MEEVKDVQQQDKNFVLIIKYECGESGYLTDKCDLYLALQEYQEERLKQLNMQSKHFELPTIKEAQLYRVFKSCR